ncbi:MAG TPA: cysteine--tRNA ligase, partial [Pyrodictium sp.]|nr:cysteine--tRNA ligase [Pyrodictium sp.]
EEWRQEVEVLKEKKKPYDFALWKAWKPGEPYWEAPWGRGRPGWHIECSVMSSKYLGRQFEIHGGGQDLIFPHHENERAQSEALFGVKPWVKYWLHTGYLTIHGEKMSKSLGNIIPLREAVKKWGAEVLRLWLLSAHYRTQLDYSDGVLEQARSNLRRLKMVVEDLRKVIKSNTPPAKVTDKEMKIVTMVEKTYMEFHEAMSNDFNTAKALAAVMELVRIVNRDIVPSEMYVAAIRAYKVFEDFNQVFGVLDDVMYGVAKLEHEKFIEELVDLIVRVRGKLRKRKLYDIADEIRAELRKLGIQLYDYPGGKTVWRLERT